MALYTQDSIERVKAAVDMVELVGARTDLKRVGTRFQGLCPFHDERTPSFSVNADPGLYHCFGCGASGDAIKFVQETEGLDFPQSIEHLAERYRIELVREAEDPRAEERRLRRERLLGLVDRTASYYSRYLWESAEAGRAREYLAARGLSEEVLGEFRVGFAPKAWDRVVGASRRDGYREDEIISAGLAQRGRQGGLYDRFRGRITFPLADVRGRVVGFGARALRDDQKPKYLNSSESELFQKGRHLFGLDRARATCAKTGFAVVVEGYTDVLALHGSGITQAVAVMGTSLTQEQLAELGRYARRVVMALDADTAGREAMLRSARMAEKRELDMVVVDMPDGRDPADLVAVEGADGFRARMNAARTVPDFAARRVLAESDLGTAGGRDAALEAIRPLVAHTRPRSATRDELVRHIADRLDVPPEYIVNTATTETQGSDPRRQATSAPAAPRPTELSVRRERDFLAMCVAHPTAGREHLANLSDEHLSSDALKRVRDWLREHVGDPLAGLPPEDPSLTAAVHEIVARADTQPSDEAALRVDFLWLELARIERALKRAEEDRDIDRTRVLWDERSDVRRRIDDLMGEAA